MNNDLQFFKSVFFIGAPVLVIFFILFFVSLGFFIANWNIHNTKKKNNETNDTIKDFKVLTKKDMAYWFIILFIFIVFWVSSYLYDNSKLVEYISFSGTILSIVLAIVAIIFSYFQNFTSSNISENLLKTSKSLMSSLANLDNYNEKISEFETNMNNMVSNLSDLTNCMNDTIAKLDCLDDSINDVKQKITPVADVQNEESTLNPFNI